MKHETKRDCCSDGNFLSFAFLFYYIFLYFVQNIEWYTKSVCKYVWMLVCVCVFLLWKCRIMLFCLHAAALGSAQYISCVPFFLSFTLSIFVYLVFVCCAFFYFIEQMTRQLRVCVCVYQISGDCSFGTLYLWIL